MSEILERYSWTAGMDSKKKGLKKWLFSRCWWVDDARRLDLNAPDKHIDEQFIRISLEMPTNEGENVMHSIVSLG